jgi:hypothetical protein
MSDVTRILSQIERGHAKAAEELLPLLKERYEAGVGFTTVKIIPGHGHKVSPSFVECQELLDFFIANR